MFYRSDRRWAGTEDVENAGTQTGQSQEYKSNANGGQAHRLGQKQTEDAGLNLSGSKHTKASEVVVGESGTEADSFDPAGETEVATAPPLTLRPRRAGDPSAFPLVFQPCLTGWD